MTHLSTTTQNRSIAAALILTLAVAAFPLPASAARGSLGCELTMRADGKETPVRSESTIIGKNGDTIVLAWTSENASTAMDARRREIALNGSTTITVSNKPQDVSYTFRNGSKRVTCSATVTSVSADISERSLRKSSSRPILSGTASGVTHVRVVLTEDGQSKTSYDRTVRVSRGKWKTSSIRNLDDGAYTINVYAAGKNLPKGMEGTAAPLLDSAEYRHGKGSSNGNNGSNSSSSTRLSSELLVSSIPLLAGGTARAGETVPVAYLQLRSNGSESLVLSSIELRQKGTLGTANISALSVVDDQGIERGRTTGNAPFSGMTGYVPVSMTLAPGEMRLVTVKATLGSGAVSGLSLVLNTEGVGTSGTLRSALPINGVTWMVVQ